MKLDKNTKDFYIKLGIVILLILFYTRPVSFNHIMKNFNDGEIIQCEAYYYLREDIDGKVLVTDKYKKFDVNSEDYKELIELLNSTKYKKQLSNFFKPQYSGYSITLNPSVKIAFSNGNEIFEFCTYGKDLRAGLERETSDYTPRGRIKFQEKVVNFVDSHGTIIEENSEVLQ